MPRANRFFIPGYVWHITSRCINKEFHLKFIHDKRRLLYWLHQAKQRFDISILNYTITSNHIHIIITNNYTQNSIPQAMQLVLGRVAQEYNIRKRRKGHFWQDRYHATAVESGTHLLNCMIYVDLNMVRAGVVTHPRDYPFCGYQELLEKKKRCTLIDKIRVAQLLGVNLPDLKAFYEQQINTFLEISDLNREDKWTSSLAVGGYEFVERFKKNMGSNYKNILIKKEQGLYTLRTG